MPETQQTTEVQKTTTSADGTAVRQSEVSQVTEMSGVVVAQRVVWFVVGVVNVLIAIRFVLLLLGANQSAGFVDFIYGITSVFVAPFVGIFGETTYGRFMFEWSSLLAIVVYSLIAWRIVKLLTLSRPHEEI